MEIIHYAIDMMNGKPFFYEPIYSLELMKLKNLKRYIETILINDFIKPSKSLIDILMIFVWNLNNSFCLYINYKCHNNLIIKN